MGGGGISQMAINSNKKNIKDYQNYFMCILKSVINRFYKKKKIDHNDDGKESKAFFFS